MYYIRFCLIFFISLLFNGISFSNEKDQPKIPMLGFGLHASSEMSGLSLRGWKENIGIQGVFIALSGQKDTIVSAGGRGFVMLYRGYKSIGYFGLGYGVNGLGVEKTGGELFFGIEFLNFGNELFMDFKPPLTGYVEFGQFIEKRNQEINNKYGLMLGIGLHYNFK